MAEEKKLFQLEILTPERIFYRGEAAMIEFTAEEGKLGILPGHIPLTTVIAPGSLTIQETECVRQAVLTGGFAQILPDKVMILAETAEWCGENGFPDLEP